jgi:hypothetical protein
LTFIKKSKVDASASGEVTVGIIEDEEEDEEGSTTRRGDG